MDVSLVALSAVGIALVPVVLGLVSVAKMFITDTRWAPVLSIVFGIGLAFFVPAVSIGLTVLQGLLIGLTASGLFSGVKTLMSSPSTPSA